MKASTALAEDLSAFPVPTFDGSEPPVTLAPRDQMPLASLATSTHVHITTQRYRPTHNQN